MRVFERGAHSECDNHWKYVVSLICFAENGLRVDAYLHEIAALPRPFCLSRPDDT